MQPEINPNYFRYQTPFMQNYFNPQPTYPYSGMQTQLQVQNPVQNQPMPQSYMPKVVDGIDAVKATDIPMDGSTYYFPKADGTEIYAKKWNVDGSTSIVSYLPIETAKSDSAIKTSTKSFQEQIEGLDARITSVLDQVNVLVGLVEKNQRSNTKKKEVNADEC